MVERRRATWFSAVLQTATILLALLGIALAGERRITSVETRLTAVERAVIELQKAALRQDVRMDQQAEMMAKTVAILDIVCKNYTKQ
jgi:uncharacterized coiled-coil protein SlyX